MTKKIFHSILIVAVAVLISSLLIIMGCLYEYFGRIQENQLNDELSIASAGVENGGEKYLEKLESDRYRLTWIAEDGTVIYDTQTEAAEMENHSDRQEIKDAFAKGEGSSTRYSSTLLERNIYRARLLEDGTVLRISVSFGAVGTLVLGTIQPFIAVLLFAGIVSLFLAKKLSRDIVEPLNRLDLEKPLENEVYEEVSPLLNRINRQQKEITEQLLDLKKEKEEFAQITDSMSEGLVLLDENKNVVSINPAAQKLFDATEECVGQSFLTVNRNRDINFAIESSFSKGHSDIKIDHNGRKYQVNISKVESENEFSGAVLLAFDVSEQEYAERNRREFTANVSHELKTPLQSIIGSSELIENNLVKPEDMQRFVGHIHSEASRLVTLIGDIIRLSELDEGSEVLSENVDLLETAKEAADVLKDAAASSKVSLSVSGENAVIVGSYRMVYEIIYNLCDNAIKYNVEGGSVSVSVSEDKNDAILVVKDTGIGIPEESHARIFERFYRVDKSHSKASGGTGLGLSIVKHAVQYHHGKIELESKPGSGTEIKVIFPITQ